MADPIQALDQKAKNALNSVFITLFLDLVGFSIIFPLFPSMLTYYMEREGSAGLMGAVVSALNRFTAYAGGPEDIGVIILFGGFLSAIYSLLQFAFAPIIGALSDRYGRRPVLLFCIAGIVLSYVMWFFAGRFVILLIARFIGGAMSGNISTASAVVADVTSKQDRSKGMARIGVAFGLGFILGPVLGGFSAGINLLDHAPQLEAYGVNPFSVPALVALGLSLANLAYVAVKFQETLPEMADKRQGGGRTANLVSLFKTEDYPGVTKTSLINFLFLAAFSGMEFSLTFLGMDRFGYGPKENAYMLVFVGVVLVLMQGGYVHRRSPVIGPKRMSIHGFFFCIPGLILVGAAPSSPVLYGGLLLMAIGSAQIIPCLTALASIYTPPHEQGRVLGVFRSLGALARGVGPVLACILYWRLGSATAYYIAASTIILPLVLASSLPPSRLLAEEETA